MKAAVFYGKHDLRIENIEKPVPKAGEVVIRVKACGICGTDVHIFNGDEGAAKLRAERFSVMSFRELSKASETALR